MINPLIMKRIFILAVCLLLANGSLVAFAACTGSSDVNIPGVQSEGANILTAHIALKEGNGTVYVSTSPKLAVSTEESFEKSADIAMLHEDNVCDVLISFPKIARSGNVIEGPSGGLAIATAAIAALRGAHVRPNLVLTGDLDYAGDVQPVGGLYEKATAASQLGYPIIMPVLRAYERVSLFPVIENGGIVYQAQTLDEVLKLALTNTPIKSNINITDYEELYDVPAYAKSAVPEFGTLVGLMEGDLLGLLGNMDGGGATLKNYVAKYVHDQEGLSNKGYAYPVANNFFLLYINLLMTKYASPELGADTFGCLSELGRRNITITENNYEWYIGYRTRLGWAERKFNESKNKDDPESMRSMANARAWCNVAGRLADIAQESAAIKATQANKNALRPIAEELIKIDINDSDAKWYSDAAKEFYRNGEYGAVVYSMLYAKSFDNDGRNLSREEVGRYLLENTTGIWSNIYKQQVAYGYYTNRTSEGVYNYARDLEAYNRQIGKKLREAGTPQAQTRNQTTIGNATASKNETNTERSNIESNENNGYGQKTDLSAAGYYVFAAGAGIAVFAGMVLIGILIFRMRK
ncbi:hypothetical protein COT30_00530 [Candidatus Micrarchaeota archaeon CG08_land_8_20_14_0_20_49_17]|nr:MAG: hypothetical protein COT30_00530 [Candidatus Micrarchaeota archaeon CG08_land_8_20_14_0_20_49_17]